MVSFFIYLSSFRSIFFYKGQTRPLSNVFVLFSTQWQIVLAQNLTINEKSVYFRPFVITISILQIEKSIDGVLGIRIRDRWMVGKDEYTELWWHPSINTTTSKCEKWSFKYLLQGLEFITPDNDNHCTRDTALKFSGVLRLHFVGNDLINWAADT